MVLNINNMDRQKIIYMPLLNEGTKVLRPVVAHYMGDNLYKIIGTEDGLQSDDLDEEWLFPIGSHVTCKIEQNGNEMILVADNPLLSVVY